MKTEQKNDLLDILKMNEDEREIFLQQKVEDFDIEYCRYVLLREYASFDSGCIGRGYMLACMVIENPKCTTEMLKEYLSKHMYSILYPEPYINYQSIRAALIHPNCPVDILKLVLNRTNHESQLFKNYNYYLDVFATKVIKNINLPNEDRIKYLNSNSTNDEHKEEFKNKYLKFYSI